MRSCAAVLWVVLFGCGDNESASTRALFDLSSSHDTPATFWDMPFPADVRLDETGSPDMTGFYTKGPNTIGEVLVETIAHRRGFPQNPVAYIRFDGELSADAGAISAGDSSSPVAIVDIDPDSPQRGEFLPTIARTLPEDDFAPHQLLAIAPRPGIILRPATTYAVLVFRHLGDASGEPLGVAPDFAALADPDRDAGSAIEQSFAPLWPALDDAGLDAADLAVATVFTTGDVVGEFAVFSDALLERHSASLSAPVLDPAGIRPDYCELSIDLTVPQFLTGTEPYNTGGVFELDAGGVPMLQGERTVPAVITIPRTAMPAGGFPLMLYFHGSGGVHDQVADASRSLSPGVDGPEGEGPAMYYARIGFAAAGSALPVSPDRVPGATDIAYINFQNLTAFPFLFRQGVIEQRMFLSALTELAIDPEVLVDCTGVTLPEGETHVHFDDGQLYAGGQSMGGMYTNMFGAVDPRPRALVPTGAGGYWSLMILTSSLFSDEAGLLSLLLGTPNELDFLHPGMHSLEMAWEAAEPLVYVPRLSRWPIEGRTAKPVYQPVGKDDSYFAPPVFDAMALAYGHEQAGQMVWPEMQEALALVGRDGVLDYPVANNLTSESGEDYTGVVVQYEGDDIGDPHQIYRQLDDVIYQYSCFLHSMRTNGVAVVAEPAELGTPCPTPP